MLCEAAGGKCGRGTLLIVLAVALFFAAISVAEAGLRRERRKPSAFQVALQPFSLVREAVHAVADPVVQQVPRVAARIATAPKRIADHVTTGTQREVIRGELVDEEDLAAEEGEELVSRRTMRQSRRIERASYAQPIRVAYVTTRPALPAEAESEEADDAAHDGSADDTPSQQNFAEEEEIGPEPLLGSRGSKPMVAGRRAVLRNGIAYAPSHAPQAVKNAIWAANTLRRKPYVWGGGHGSFYDRGYDCSGTVSFALHGAGALRSPLPSSEFMRYGERGRGRWITIYSRRGHTFAVIAGLRLDTTDFENGGNSGPRWHTDMRDTRGYVARHPARM